jgi:hypothetical protein
LRENQPFVRARRRHCAFARGAFHPRFRRIAFNVGSSALAAYLRWNGAETESFAGTREKSAN